MAVASSEYRCFVGGLAWATDDRSLGDAFRSFGEVVDSKVINDRETGRSRGFGFVTFADEQSMLDAIEAMNGKELDGRTITVNQAQSRSGGNGGGYRRSTNAGGGGGRGYGSAKYEDKGNKGSYGGRERTDRGYGGHRGGGGRGGVYNDGNGGSYDGGYGGGNRSGYGGNSRFQSGGGADSGTWRK